MTPLIPEWTIVLAGGWNTNIFQPDWVAKNVFGQDEINVEFFMGAAQGALSYGAGKISLIVRPDKLIFGCKDTSTDALARAEAAALKVLELLPHTPVGAFGINFGFSEEAPSADLTRLFQTADIDPISQFGCTIQKTSLARQVAVENRILNLTHTFEAGQVIIVLNFHYPVANADTAREKLLNSAIPCRDIAKRLLANVYKLEVLEAQT